MKPGIEASLLPVRVPQSGQGSHQIWSQLEFYWTDRKTKSLPPQSSRLSLAVFPALPIATVSERPSLVTVQLAFLVPDSLSFQCLALSGTAKPS